MRGSLPGPASDVFICGLMLYELLASEHPYWQDDQAEYAKLVKARAARPPALVGLMPSPASNAEVSAALHRCLLPDPARRPTAAEMRTILSGRSAKAELPKPVKSITPVMPIKPDKPVAAAVAASATTPRSTPAAIATADARATGEPIRSEAMELAGPDGRAVQIGVRTELAKVLVRQFGPDGEFWDRRQCVVEPNSGRQ